jgi:hypothetical protein
MDIHPRLMVDEVTAHALRAHALASEGTTASRTLELTRHAIRSWRHLAGPDSADDITPAPTRRS